MANYMYGVLSNTGGYIETSKTERGAKCYATRHGYSRIGKRDTNHYLPVHIASRVNGAWSYW